VPAFHDETYKRVFSFSEMVEDLLRTFAGPWVDELDFSTLRERSAEYVSDLGPVRRGDLLWLVDYRDQPRTLLVPIEFQSSPDPDMALRLQVYAGLAAQGRLRSDAGKRGAAGRGREFATLLVVLYNGERPWKDPVSGAVPVVDPATGAWLPGHPERREVLFLDEVRMAKQDWSEDSVTAMLFQLRARWDPDTVVRAGKLLAAQTGGNPELRKAVVGWLANARRASAMSEEELVQATHSIEEATMDFAERLRMHQNEWKAEGLAEGKAVGLAEGKAEGEAAGLAKGRIEASRALAARLAALKFGPEAAERLSVILEGVAAPERVEEIADAVVQCDAAAELLDRARAIAGRPDSD